MLATIIYANNPFHPTRNREVTHIKRKKRISTLAPKRSEPFICLVNGKPLLRKNNGWERTVKDGEVVAFVTLPQGGGGGSNPLKIILAITISIMAGPAAIALLGPVAATTAMGGLTLLGSAVAAGITFAGNALVNALIRDPAPSLSGRSISAIQAASPTYNISGQGNQARIGQSIPVLYGRNMIYMDFAAQPYTEYSGNEQFLYQLFVIGQGEYDVEQLRLEDTVIENNVIQDGQIHLATGSFEEIEYQICYNQNITLFPQNVSNSVEVAGQESNSVSGTYSQTTTVITVTKTGHGYLATEPVYLNFTTGTATSGFYNVATVTSADVFTVTSATSTSTSGNVIIADVIGSFVVNAADTLATALSYDVVLPRGLYYANDSGGLNEVSVSFAGQYREIDNDGAPVGNWTTGFNQTVTLKTTTPQRFSYRVAVASGRYEARFARTNLKETDTRYGNDVVWGGLRGYLVSAQNYGNITMLAMRIKASNQLSGQASRRINAVTTRKLATYDGNNWTNAIETRNPAWAFADLVTASYGMNLAYSRIDAQQLFDLSAVWALRGDTFDAVFDGQQPCWEALTQIARVGRAMPYLQGGNVYVTRDSEEITPVAMFTMRNIGKNSFKLSYLLPNEETADAVDVEYWDNGVFQQKVVRAALPDSTETTIVNRQLFGCSSRAQAYREGMYMAASNRYRRRMLSFQTEMEGFIPTVGDLIAVQHDMPQWGLSGEVTNYDAGTLTVTLSEPVNTATGGNIFLEDEFNLLAENSDNLVQDFNTGNYYIAFRKRNGGSTDVYSVTLTGNPYQVILNETPSITPDFGIDRERTHFAFGLADSLYVECKVLGVRPRSLEKVEISAVVDSSFVYTADTGAIPDEDAWQLPNRITVPVIRGLLARSNPADINVMYLSWQPAAGADRYLIEVSDNSGGWTRIGDTSASSFTAVATYGSATVVRVAGIGATRGAWVEVQYGLSAGYMWNAIDTTLMWNAVDTTPMWVY
jgi:hypothetical protein